MGFHVMASPLRYEGPRCIIVSRGEAIQRKQA